MQIKIKNFNLKHTLESGQFFRYQKKGEWYYCQERDKLFKIRQISDKIEFYGTDTNHIKKLFGLNVNYDKIVKELSKDPTLKKALRKYNGLRIMQRDPWETLVSFQCSIMSNIKKIQLNMNKIAENFGEKIELDEFKSHTFPKEGKLNDIEKLKESKTGFRAKYIHEMNKKVDEKYFTKLGNYEQAHQKLTELPGIGPKVADCICLFALGKMEAFPIDVWMERVMKETYGVDKNAKEFAQKRWGKNAGYAQQFLYHWRRNEQ